jgi:hypothetical protein
MFEQLMGSIQDTFRDIMPEGFCLSCFLTGLVEGAAIGLLAMAAIATAPAWLAVALVVGLAALGAYGIYNLVSNWDQMNGAQKSEAIGGIVGGLIAGRFGPPMPPIRVPMPAGIMMMATENGAMLPVLVTQPVALPVSAMSAVSGTSAGAGGVAMVASSGGGGGNNSTPEETEELKKIGSLSGKDQKNIEADLVSRGYNSATAHSGGKVLTKDLGNGRTMAVRLDPPTVRNPPKGFADEVPHAHKESIPTSTVQNGNYPNGPHVRKFDDAGNTSSDPTAVHIPTK